MKKYTSVMNKAFKLCMIFAVMVLFAFITNAGTSYAKTLKIRYNNKTVYYKGNQIVSYIDGKKVKAGGTKGIKLNKQVMVSYKDVFKKGCGIKTTYKKSSGKITFSANGKSVKLKVGSKKATVNGKKKTLKQAPVKVKYVKKKITKILVPAKTVAKAFGYTYSYSSGNQKLSLTSPFLIYYDKEWHVYNKYFGGLVYDNITADMNYMPAMSISGSVMIPAEQVLKNIMGLDYTYEPSSGTISVKSLEHKLEMNIGSNSAVLDGSKTTLGAAPVIVKRKDTNAESIMIPAHDVINMLGYYYDWNPTLNIITIHTKTYFSWKASESEYDKEKYSNSIKEAFATYDINNKSIIIKTVFEKSVSTNDIKLTDNIADSQTLLFEFETAKSLISNSSHILNGKTINSVELAQDKEQPAKLLITFNNNNIDYKYEIKDNTLTITIAEEVSTDYAIRFGRPDAVQFSDISTKDDYMNNRFFIYIPGNYTEYYAANKISVNSSVIKNTSIYYNEASQVTEIMVNTTKLQGYKIVSLGSVVGVIVDNPGNVYEHIVVLDPGHGGKDPGAKSKGVNESDLNLKILYECAKEYFDSPDSNVKAYWTRTDDTFISLQDRAAYAKSVGADIFISLHMNSSTSSTAKGTEVYYSTVNNTPSPEGITSYNLAAACISRIVANLGMSRRGIKSANYYVIKNNTVPAVLIELGFITNNSDFNTITSAQAQQAAAKSIFDAAIAIFNE